MKLALVRQKYNPFGGAERFVERALQALRENGTSVTLITREWKKVDATRGVESDVRVCNPSFFTRKGRDAGFAHAVQQIISNREFDLIQSHERIPGCHLYRAGDGVHATWLALRARIQSPLARMTTRLHPWHRYTLAAEAAMFKHPDLRAVICNSAMVKRDIATRFGVADSKLHVIHNGVDLGYFHPELRNEFRHVTRDALNIPAKAPLLLFVGSGFERKGLSSLLHALAAMQNREAQLPQLLVVGRDKHQSAMEQLARTLGIADRTHFIGGKADVRPYYAAADVFALPTLYDPFPNAALEALACGLPVLTSPTSGAAELIIPACGAIADALDHKAQAVALDRLIENAEAMRSAARAAAENCSLAHMTARLMALYASLETNQVI
jgi:UDP-glucose:(heptosyl)LPS alpha-1,3-glucosyltransferase